MNPSLSLILIFWAGMFTFHGIIGILSKRIDQVKAYHDQAFDIVSELIDRDNELGRPDRGIWRLIMLARVDYDKMVYHFWKRLDSFYTPGLFDDEPEGWK